MRNTVNTDADRIDKIENQLSELKDLICTRFQSDNKHVEKYNSVISEKSVYKPTETFQYTHYSSCHPPGVKKGFIKGEAIRLLRTNSSERNFQEAMCNFKTRLEARGYPKSLIEKTLSEVSFAARQSTLKKQTKKTKGKILPFVTAYHPGVKNLKQILMQEWNLIQNQPLLKTIYKTPPIISYKRGKSLKDILVRAKL